MSRVQDKTKPRSGRRPIQDGAASRPAVKLPVQLPAPPPVPTPGEIAAFLAYEIPLEIESATGFHFPAEVLP